jgi:hypothetical protein
LFVLVYLRAALCEVTDFISAEHAKLSAGQEVTSRSSTLQTVALHLLVSPSAATSALCVHNLHMHLVPNA